MSIRTFLKVPIQQPDKWTGLITTTHLESHPFKCLFVRTKGLHPVQDITSFRIIVSVETLVGRNTTQELWTRSLVFWSAPIFFTFKLTQTYTYKRTKLT